MVTNPRYYPIGGFFCKEVGCKGVIQQGKCTKEGEHVKGLHGRTNRQS